MNTPRNILLSVFMLVVVFVAWESLCRIFDFPVYILPPPSMVFVALYNGAISGIYLKHLEVTLISTLLGFTVGSLIGFVLGTAIAMSRRIEYFLYPYIVMFQSLPKVALAPLIVVWFGLGLTSKVINAALVTFFPLMVNTIVGLHSADENRIKLMKSLAANDRQIFFMLRLQTALPHIMAGLEIGMVFALIGTIVAEFVGAEAGLGMLIQSMNFNLDVAGQFSVLLILAFVGLVLNRIVQIIRRRILFWDASEKARVVRDH